MHLERKWYEGPRGAPGRGVVPPVIDLGSLPTVFEPAAWWNNRGRVDRSACFDLSAKEAMGLGRAPAVAAENGIGRLTTRVFELGPEDLRAIDRQRPPRSVRGDYRWKAPAMQPEAIGRKSRWDREAKRGRRALKRLRTPYLDGPDHLCVGNPNKGASATKVMGLPPGWHQAMRVETWEMGFVPPGDPRLPVSIADKGLVARRHFLICPGVERLMKGTVAPAKVGGRWDDPAKPPPLSTRPRGSNAPRGRRIHACVERAQKLYLPLCTEQELKDAGAVQRWLLQLNRMRDAGLVEARQSELEAALIGRYGPLFQPRVMLCKECLGMRYGVVHRSQLPAASAWRFPKGRAPEFPDLCALNHLGRRHEHNQFKEPLTKSELKNRKTRAAALARRRTLVNAPRVAADEAARLRLWAQRERERKEAERRKRLKPWEQAMEDLEG